MNTHVDLFFLLNYRFFVTHRDAICKREIDHRFALLRRLKINSRESIYDIFLTRHWLKISFYLSDKPFPNSLTM